MKQKYLILLFLALPLFISCRKENAFDCFKSTGSVKTISRQLPAFHTLKLHDDFPVTIIPDNSFWVEITAGENLLSSIRTDVKDGTLEIRNHNTCNWVRSYNNEKGIKLHLPTISTIYHDGFGTLRSEDTLEVDKLIIHQIGAGDVDLTLKGDYIWLDMYELGNMSLKGTMRETVAAVWGLGKLDASAMKSEISWIQVHNGGDATVYTTDILGGMLTSKGNLYYYGNPPQAHFEVSGPGKAVAKE